MYDASAVHCTCVTRKLKIQVLIGSDASFHTSCVYSNEAFRHWGSETFYLTVQVLACLFTCLGIVFLHVVRLIGILSRGC
jgi:hypothetical protein